MGGDGGTTGTADAHTQQPHRGSVPLVVPVRGVGTLRVGAGHPSGAKQPDRLLAAERGDAVVLVVVGRVVLVVTAGREIIGTGD